MKFYFNKHSSIGNNIQNKLFLYGYKISCAVNVLEHCSAEGDAL